MKTYLSILAFVLLAFSACKSPEGAQSRAYNDDIYYSSKDKVADNEKRVLAEAKQNEENKKQLEEMAKASENSKTSTTTSDDYYTPSDGKTAVNNTTNNYYDNSEFDYDDYYDDAYAVRLRRFHGGNVINYGYYDNYYTNSYFYSGNPYNYGSSIYMGYNFWGPSYNTYSYNPSYYWYGNQGWGYDPFYNPYGYGYDPYGYGYNPYGYGYGNGFGYNPYGAGYNNGYWDGYYSGMYNNNYFNSYDNNSYYYGPRGTTGSNGRETAQPTLASRMVNELESQAKANPENWTKDDYGRIKPAYTSSTETYKPTSISIGSGIKPTGPMNPAYKPENTSKPTQTENPAYKEKPSYNKEQPSYKEQPSNEKPAYKEQPAYEEKPAYKETPSIKREKPVEQPKYEKPRNESLRVVEQPKATPSSAPASRGGSSAPSGSKPPRR